MAARRRRRAILVQQRDWSWINALVGPALLAVAGWTALQFVDVRDAVIKMQVTIGYIQEELGKHTTQLDNLQKDLDHTEHRQ